MRPTAKRASWRALEVRELVAGSFLERAPLVPVSARTGEGLDELRQALRAAASAVKGAVRDGPARLPIDRVFSVRGFGTVVTGTLVSGRILADDRADGPAVRSGRTPGVGARRAGARQPQRGGDRRPARRRQRGESRSRQIWRAARSSSRRARSRARRSPTPASSCFPAPVHSTRRARPLPPGHGRNHRARGSRRARIERRGAGHRTGHAGFVRLRLERPAVLTGHDRYILRAYSPPTTIAGGEILDPAPPRAAIRTAAALERSRQLAAGGDGDVARDLHEMIEEAGRRAFPAGRAGVAGGRAAAGRRVARRGARRHQRASSA